MKQAPVTLLKCLLCTQRRLALNSFSKLLTIAQNYHIGKKRKTNIIGTIDEYVFITRS